MCAGGDGVKTERRATRRVGCVERSDVNPASDQRGANGVIGDCVRTGSSSQQQCVCVCSSVSGAATRQANGSAREESCTVLLMSGEAALRLRAAKPDGSPRIDGWNCERGPERRLEREKSSGG